MALTKVTKGIRGLIIRIKSSKEIFMRLASIGIIEGSIVNVLSNNGTSPLILECDGRKLAISQKLAQNIFIKI